MNGGRKLSEKRKEESEKKKGERKRKGRGRSFRRFVVAALAFLYLTFHHRGGSGKGKKNLGKSEGREGGGKKKKKKIRK